MEPHDQDKRLSHLVLRLLSACALMLASLSAHAQGTAAEQACADALQGKVAWNQQGTRSWDPNNLRRLCQGTANPAATVACFQAEIRNHNDWSRAIGACQAAAAPAASGANGRNVGVVVFGQAGGQRLGTYRQVAPRQWVEISNSGAIAFRFEEAQRDDWSVYLVDRSRGVNLQLDLHTRKVMYSDASTARREQYAILDAGTASAATPAPPSGVAAAPAPQPSPPPVMAPAPPVMAQAPAPSPAAPAAVAPNGRNVVVVTFGQSFQRIGEIRRTGGRGWQEFDAAGRPTYSFEEVQRDDWSVYLSDRSRGVSLQLDLHTRKVMYSDGANPQRRPIYDIQAAGV